MSFFEVLKGVGPKLAAGIKKIPATVGAWSQTTQIIVAGCTAGSLMVASVGGVAIYQHNTAAQETVVQEQQTEATETQLESEQETVTAETQVMEPQVQVTEFVAVPEYRSCAVTSDSLEKDLTLYIKGENNSKIKGEAFQVKLISPNDKKKLNDAIKAVEAINEKIAGASEEAASGTAPGDDGASVAADEGGGMLIPGDGAAEDIIYLSSVTGLELSEKEQLLIEKKQVMQAYCDALASVDGANYTDENSDGMIYISQIKSGDYLACLVPSNTYIPKNLTVKVNVKDKLEYKAVETIEDKTVTEAVAGDVEDKHEEIIVENVATDTVEWVDSLTIEGDAAYTTASPKFTEPAAATREKNVRLKAKLNCTCKGIQCTGDSKDATCKYCSSAGADLTKCKGVAASDCNCSVKCTSQSKSTTCPYCKTGDAWKTCPKEPASETEKETETESQTEKETETESQTERETETESQTETESESESESQTETENTETASVRSHYAPRVATSAVTPPAIEYEYGKLTLRVSATTIYHTADGTNATAEVTVTAPEGLTPALKVNGEAVTGTKITIKASDYKTGTVSVIGLVKEPTDQNIEKPEEVATETIAITVVSAETELKDASGNKLYQDKEGKTAATVGDYKKDMTLYCKTGSADNTYYGWQTINGIRYYYDKNGNKVTGEQIIGGNQYKFGTDGALLTSGFGIDVSKWQGNIDWSQAKSVVSFAIIRAGIRGTTGALSIDSYAGTNITNAKANGVKVGLYFYSRAQNELQAVEEASLAVSIAKQYGGISLPIYIDMEDSTQSGLTTAQRDAIVLAFCQTVKNEGFSAGIYANKTWLTTKLTPSSYSGCSIWCAQYAAACTYTGRYDIWQYSSKGSIPGIKGDVDLNQSFF